MKELKLKSIKIKQSVFDKLDKFRKTEKGKVPISDIVEYLVDRCADKGDNK